MEGGPREEWWRDEDPAPRPSAKLAGLVEDLIPESII